MKLFRYGDPGCEKPGILDREGHARDLSPLVPDLGPEQITPESLDMIRNHDLSSLPLIEGPYRFGPCLANVRRFFCIGLNYSDHAAESNLPVPEMPIVFMKVCPVSGADDPIVIPKNSLKTDWEVELGVVIGRAAQHVSPEDALSHVAGYCVVNDVSERAFQNEFGGQWVKGKSCDTFGPIGPYLVTPDLVPDPQNLDMYLDVNGVRRQTGNTRTMIFSVAHIISHLSRFITLRPGDLISTGTPPGVGMGMTPPVFLRPGDTIKLGIGDLGQQHQDVVAFSDHATVSEKEMHA